MPGIAFDHKSKGFDVTWSHKSVAYAAGLGTFGIHHLLITKSGCVGRFGALIISAEIPPTLRPNEEFCCYKKGEICLACVARCPAGALSIRGLDKDKCYRQLQKMPELFPNLISLPVESVQPDPVLSGLAEIDKSFLLLLRFHDL